MVYVVLVAALLVAIFGIYSVFKTDPKEQSVEQLPIVEPANEVLEKEEEVLAPETTVALVVSESSPLTPTPLPKEVVEEIKPPVKKKPAVKKSVTKKKDSE